ncbi:MAG: nucleoside triphosphate pyrophosphohydrolase [Elsteraceae bacterium]
MPLTDPALSPVLDESSEALRRLLAIMRRLRDPVNGCSWDVAQTFATIAPYTIEEAYEVADAIERGTPADLCDELGDLLLQVVFHARMAEEAGLFDFAAVASSIAEKMIRRHPHIFGEDGPKSADAVRASWEALKAAERSDKAKKSDRPESVLDDVGLAFPALMRAEKLQKRAARVGFDWGAPEPVLAKIAEEIGELGEEMRQGAPIERLTDELGDVLFAVVNLARHLKIDPETALRGTNAKFERRFRYMEEKLLAQGKRPADSTLDDMEALWVEAKQKEKS